MPDGFNLRALIRDVADSSTIADPATLADEVARRIGPKQRADALAQALPTVVQHVVSRDRAQVTPGGQRLADAHRGPSARGSSKVAGIRETWRRMLRDRIAVGPARDDWKFLADCTATDLQFAAEIREEHARRNAARADQLRELADRLARAGVATVGQLPDSDLGAALGAAA